jgi:16S rRNA (guanine966-N2)-methyltransferase
MRIVAGKYRRRTLLANPGSVTRPITDRVKETLFERLLQRIEGRRVADVFSGTGTLGLEALSRGALGVVFIESDRQAFQLLKQNVAKLGVEDMVLCWQTDVLKTSFHPKNVDHLLPYETVFFDPPYRMLEDLQPGSRLYKSLERLARDGITSPDALLVLRSPRKATFSLPACWKKLGQLDISSMEIHLFERTPTHVDS